MRIGIDMLAVQSPGSRGRGVGRYARQLVESLIAAERGHQFVLYAHEGLPDDQVPWTPRVEFETPRISRERGERLLRQVTTRLSVENPDRLDLILTLNPLELVPGYDAAPRSPGGPATCSLVYDLIPFLEHDRYLSDPLHARWMYRRLRQLRHDDLLLTISESTRNDALDLLRVPQRKVVSISGATTPGMFKPDFTEPMSARVRSLLYGLGIHYPFLFSLSGIDSRKNLEGLLRAFAKLPPELLASRQLVVSCYFPEEHRHRYYPLADQLGILDRVVFTGEVSDEALLALYQRCSAFVFPSLYEGLGLPLLEAMRCGTPVIAGNNSSQVEVVGDAGLLVDAQDPTAIAAAMARLLSEGSLRHELSTRGLARSGTFTWRKTADRALDAIENLPRTRLSRARQRHRLAVFSPWPPKASGISDYAARLVDSLADRYQIDLVHEPGYIPEPALRDPRYSAVDHRLYRRLARLRQYRGTLFQMGNSHYHRFLYDDLIQFDGIVTLHDFNLAGFHWWLAHKLGDPSRFFGAEVSYNYPEKATSLLPELDSMRQEPGGMQEAFTRRRLYMNRRVFVHAQAVVVHSPWCLGQVEHAMPDLTDRTVVIPLGARPAEASASRRLATRDRFSLPRDALILASFGNLSQAKMNVEAIEAYAAIRSEIPPSLLIFAGQDWEQGQAAARVKQLGLEDHVLFLGRQDEADFLDLIAACDIGISLRRPPTYGETSAALLDLFRTGIPTLVTDTDTFSDYPDTIVRKIDWERDGLPGLVRAMRELATQPGPRWKLGQEARRHVAAHHTWPQVAELYSQLIERVHENRLRSPSSGVART